MDPDSVIAAILMRMRAPPGSPAAKVNERFAPIDEELGRGSVDTIDMSTGEKPVTKVGQMDYIRPIAGAVNPEGIAAFLASAPMSTNVEDRSQEDVMDAIKRYMQEMNTEGSGEDFRPEPSEQLPIPNFDYRKRSR